MTHTYNIRAGVVARNRQTGEFFQSMTGMKLADIDDTHKDTYLQKAEEAIERWVVEHYPPEEFESRWQSVVITDGSVVSGEKQHKG